MSPEDSTLLELLQRHRPQLLDRWRTLVLDSYPEEAARFFRREQDSFRNPVGRTVMLATATVLDGVLLGHPASDVAEALEAIVRIRAVQQFSAAEAVAFVFLLKRAIREELAGTSSGDVPWRALADLESRIDALALSAFEIYIGCRERIYEIRLNEARRRTATLFERLDAADRRPSTGEESPGMKEVEA